MLKYILMCLICITITSCVTRTLETSFDLPDAPELKMRDVKWEVYLVDDNSKICLSPQAYSNLSLNMQDLKVYMIYQNKIIKIYKGKNND